MCQTQPTTTSTSGYCHICGRSKYAHQIACMCHILDGHTEMMYVHKSATYAVTSIKPCHLEYCTHFANYISCYCHVSMNKYGCQIVHTAQTALILYWHIDPTVVHICINTSYYIIYCTLLAYLCMYMPYMQNM